MIIRGEIEVSLCVSTSFFGSKLLLGVMSHYVLEMSPLFQWWWDIVPNFEISWQNTIIPELICVRLSANE